MARTRRSTPRLAVPVANLIDVVFLLLIFFLVTSTQILEEALIETRAGSASDQRTAMRPQFLRIEVTAEGPRVGIGHATRLVTTDELHEHLVSSLALDNEAAIQVAAAPQATQQQLVEVLDTCHRAGTTNVVLLGTTRR